MSITRISIPIPKILQQIRISLVLLYRKIRYGYAFRKIELTQGQYAIVDPEDYNRLNKYKWYAHKNKGTYYAYRAASVYENKGSKNVKMHQQVMYDLNPKSDPSSLRFAETSNHSYKVIIDHINGDGRDNRKANLRFANYSQNSQNRRKLRRRCASEYKGVWQDKRTGRWRAQICFRGTKKHLGYFADEEQAARAYDQAAMKYHKEFARLNFAKDKKLDWLNG